MMNPIDTVVSRTVERGMPSNVLSAGNPDSAEGLNMRFSSSRYWSRGNEDRDSQISLGCTNVTFDNLTCVTMSRTGESDCKA